MIPATTTDDATVPKFPQMFPFTSDIYIKSLSIDEFHTILESQLDWA